MTQSGRSVELTGDDGESRALDIIALAAHVALNERDPRILRAALQDICRIAKADIGRSDTGYCPWCEEADAPAYLAHEGHDPECPLQPRATS